MLSYPDKTLCVNAIDFSGSICDGPGLRTVVYLQGCNRRCINCHNPQTWDLTCGVEISVSSRP